MYTVNRLKVGIKTGEVVEKYMYFFVQCAVDMYAHMQTYSNIHTV
jgi:hypothetical protein